MWDNTTKSLYKNWNKMELEDPSIEHLGHVVDHVISLSKWFQYQTVDLSEIVIPSYFYNDLFKK